MQLSVRAKRFSWFAAVALVVALSACGQQMTTQALPPVIEGIGDSGVEAVELPAEERYEDAAAVCEWLRPDDASVPWFGAWVATGGALGAYEALGVDVVIEERNGHQALAWNAADAYVRVTAVVVKSVDGGNSYVYPVRRTEDKGLTAPSEKGGPGTIEAFVLCGTYSLTVEKTAEATAYGAWRWDVTKTAHVDELAIGDENGAIGYTVEVSATPGSAGAMVSGAVYVRNDTPVEVLITEIVDQMTIEGLGSAPVSLACSLTRGPDGALGSPIAVPVIGDHASYLPLPPGGEVFCDYLVGMDFGADGQNKAKVGFKFLHGDDYAWDATFAHADVSFGDVVFDDSCVRVEDSLAGLLAEALCAGERTTWTFDYTLTVGTRDDADVVLACGDDEVRNVAQLYEGGALVAEATATVAVYVDCEPPVEVLGCTLTQGYWKTHSSYGPATYDATWALVGEDTPFYTSGLSYHGLLWTPPAGGNAYLILGHQYVAAYLNGLNGASYPAHVQAAMAEAEAFFASGATPADALSASERAELVALAGLLDGYNNGHEGVPHCDSGDAPAALL